MHIDIDYLRRMLPGSGDGFWVHLAGCMSIEFESWDGTLRRTIKELTVQDMEILYIKTLEPLVLDCNEGALRLVYASAKVTLGDGEAVSDEILSDASTRYWTAFKERAEALHKG